MNEYEEYLRTKIEFCDLERERLIRIHGESRASFMMMELEHEKKLYEHCLKKFRELVVLKA